ncbi:MAG: hypothetical protein Tsb0019_30120 [Roseibium sp.]
MSNAITLVTIRSGPDMTAALSIRMSRARNPCEGAGSNVPGARGARRLEKDLVREGIDAVDERRPGQEERRRQRGGRRGRVGQSQVAQRPPERTGRKRKNDDPAGLDDPAAVSSRRQDGNAGRAQQHEPCGGERGCVGGNRRASGLKQGERRAKQDRTRSGRKQGQRTACCRLKGKGQAEQAEDRREHAEKQGAVAAEQQDSFLWSAMLRIPGQVGQDQKRCGKDHENEPDR